MKVSESYNLSLLVSHPNTREIILSYLSPLGVDEAQLLSIHATLKELADYNMGGGIPYNVMQKLISELDSK